jgi:hypothetical protein
MTGGQHTSKSRKCKIATDPCKLREIHEQINTYIELLGQKGSTILPLIEEKVSKLQAEEKLVTKRRDELILQLECRPKAIDAQIVLEHLKDFTQVMALATPEEKAQILQLVLKNVEGEQRIAHPQRF